MKKSTPKVILFTQIILIAALSMGLGSCGNSDVIGVGLNPPDRKPIDKSVLGINNFFVNPEFGSIATQYADIKNNLKIKRYRVLFAWTNDVQRSPTSAVSYSFFDQIISALPPGSDVDIVLAHAPDWMANPANWINGNPRKTWVELWLRPTVEHFRGYPGIVGYEVWNEPDLLVLPADQALGLMDPNNYYELLSLGAKAIRELDPRRLVVMGATQSIQQNFPTTLNFNKSLRDLGVENVVDVWNIHYYGKQFESFVGNNGVADFLNGIRLPLWVTESGQQGVNEQLAYGETVWPFLMEKVPGIDRIYIFEYSSTAPSDKSFGLRTTDPNFPVSDLYVSLREG